MQRLEFHAMGSQILALMDIDRRAPILDQVPIWFEAWEQVLSRFRIDSELSKLNAGAGQPQPVSTTVWEVLCEARNAERESGGLVTPLVLEAMLRAGYDRSFDGVGASKSLGNPSISGSTVPDFQTGLEIPPVSSIVRDDNPGWLFLPSGIGLDFGGIAKGWAAMQAVKRLQSAGPALVSAGGDIAVSGPRRDGSAWPIGIRDPFSPDEFVDIVRLQNGGIATSGRDRRRWFAAGAEQHHIIDPRCGTPARTDVISATVIASSATEAETLAKTSLILGSNGGLTFLERIPGAAGMLVLEDQGIAESANLASYLSAG